MTAAMTDLTPFDRLDRYISTNRLIRKGWYDGGRTADGYERACLLVALSPEVGETHDESDCPASTLWPWLAKLTPWIDDAGSGEKWPEVVRRYAAAVRRLDPSDDAASRRALLGSLHAIVTEARCHASGRCAAACDRVLALLREGPPADDPRWATAAREAATDEMEAAREAAAAAMEAAMEAATDEMAAAMAGAVARAARVAEEAWVAEVRMAARVAMAAAGAVNGEAAADRIIDGILTALESEAGG